MRAMFRSACCRKPLEDIVRQVTPPDSVLLYLRVVLVVEMLFEEFA